MKLSQEESVIYSKQIKIEEIGIEGQKKLKKTKALVIGAGGLGCPVLIYLTRLGVGYIGMMDKDRIEYSNLNRQILYDAKDIGKNKILLAKEKIDQTNNYCNLITHNFNIDENNSTEIISYYDIIIDTTDNFNTRYIVNETCKRLHKIYIYGAVNTFEGQFAVFNYKNGIEYKDIYKNIENMNNKKCSESGITCVTTGMIGTLQTIEAFKTILGLDKKCKNFLNLYNIVLMEYKKKKVKIHSLKEKYKELNRHNKLDNNIKREYKNRIIIDLRNSEMFKIKHLKKAINITLLEIPCTLNLIQKYKKNHTIVICCNNYSKSINISNMFKGKGIKHSIEKYEG